MAEPFLSEIRIMGFNYPPKGWAFCNGQFLPINQNQALFALLGTTYGGNGQTTFALPNLQGKTPIHMGNGYTLGQTGGATSHTLSLSEMPQHQHPLNATSAQAAQADGNVPSNAKMLSQSIGDFFYAGPGNATAMASDAVSSVGGSQPHPNMQPYLTLSFCIALQGIFPSRN